MNETSDKPIVERASSRPLKTDPPKPIVMEMRGVTYEDRSAASIALHDADLVVREGELAMIHLGWFQKARRLASLMQGLHRPLQGEVRFQAQDWLGDDYDRHFSMRNRIGRVFEDQAWIENINVAANVTLASRHHGVTKQEVIADVRHWGADFGVAELIQERPAFVHPSLLQRHQWVRAFLGKPVLLLLERPLKSASTAEASMLLRAVNSIRKEGTAVVWFTSSIDDLAKILEPPISHYEIKDGELLPIEGGKQR